MDFHKLKSWLLNRIRVNNRLNTICLWYLLFLMVAARKHSMEEAARFSAINKSQYSRFLRNYSGLAVYSLCELSKKQAREFSKALQRLRKGSLPWKVAILIMAIELIQLSEVYSHSLDQKHFQGYLDEFYYRFYRRFTFNR